MVPLRLVPWAWLVPDLPTNETGEVLPSPGPPKGSDPRGLAPEDRGLPHIAGVVGRAVGPVPVIGATVGLGLRDLADQTSPILRGLETHPIIPVTHGKESTFHRGTVGNRVEVGEQGIKVALANGLTVLTKDRLAADVGHAEVMAPGLIDRRDPGVEDLPVLPMRVNRGQPLASGIGDLALAKVKRVGRIDGSGTLQVAVPGEGRSMVARRRGRSVREHDQGREGSGGIGHSDLRGCGLVDATI
jgi:hypothetical protein